MSWAGVPQRPPLPAATRASVSLPAPAAGADLTAASNLRSLCLTCPSLPVPRGPRRARMLPPRQLLPRVLVVGF